MTLNAWRKTSGLGDGLRSPRSAGAGGHHPGGFVGDEHGEQSRGDAHVRPIQDLFDFSEDPVDFMSISQ